MRHLWGDQCPLSAIKDELLVHLVHLWVHHKHAAIETVGCGFKMSLLLVNCYNLVFWKEKQHDLLREAESDWSMCFL